jgi:hypothetical protein
MKLLRRRWLSSTAIVLFGLDFYTVAGAQVALPEITVTSPRA